MKIYMKFKKATKNKFVFQECTKGGGDLDPILANIPALYIAKSAITQAAQRITVTVEVD